MQFDDLIGSFPLGRDEWGWTSSHDGRPAPLGTMLEEQSFFRIADVDLRQTFFKQLNWPGGWRSVFLPICERDRITQKRDRGFRFLAQIIQTRLMCWYWMRLPATRFQFT